MSTQDNLQAAFAGESQANRKYLAFAAKAELEGYPQIARLFRAAAAAETVHAHAHFRVMNGVADTNKNLQAAIEGEGYEFREMYPAFIKEAEAESQPNARRSFDLANRVEELHHGLFQTALSNLDQGKVPPDQPFFVCQVCGNTVEGSAPDRCPVCGAPAKAFKKVE